MDTASLLLEMYDRIPPLAAGAVNGLDEEQLCRAPEPGANTIGWLVWHLARVQDHHISELLGTEQVWAGGDWAGRFGLEADPSNTGYGHGPQEVEAVRPESAEALLAYLDEVQGRTTAMLQGLSARRPRSCGRPALGSSGHPGRAPGQHRRRQPAARRTGGLRAGTPPRLISGRRVWASGRTPRSGTPSRSRAARRRRRPWERPGASRTTRRARRPGWSPPP